MDDFHAPDFMTLRDKIALKVLSTVFSEHSEEDDARRVDDYAGFVANEVDSAYEYADAILRRRMIAPE